MQEALEKVFDIDDRQSKTLISSIRQFLQTDNKYKEAANNAYNILNKFLNS